MRFITLASACLLLSGCGMLNELVMVKDERHALRDAARDAAACQLSQALQSPMGYQPLYQLNFGVCEPLELRKETLFNEQKIHADTALYGDRQCKQPVEYRLTRYAQFCNQYLRDDRLGNADDLSDYPSPWTLTPATRLPLPVEPLLHQSQPYMQRFRYVTRQVGETRVLPDGSSLYVRRGTGECALEMRVFKRNPLDQGLKPLVLFQSGGLQKRGFHSLALQSQISFYTDQGFLVFMPFTRTLGDGDGPTECRNGQWEEVVADANRALTWVGEHASELGGNGDLPALMGEGTGGLLATWLSLHRSKRISKTLLLYPFVDSGELLKQVQKGEYHQKQGIRVLQLLTGMKALDQVSLEHPAIKASSLIAQAQQRSATGLPPIRLIHGERDTRIPLQQSIGLCDAWNSHQGTDSSECGSRLKTLSGAGYQLDYCIKGIECPAGDSQSREQVRLALREARQWLRETE